MVASQKAWPENKKDGCVLKNKKNNYTELTEVCTSDVYSKHCTTDPDPVKCAACKQYDDATKVSIIYCFCSFFVSKKKSACMEPFLCSSCPLALFQHVRMTHVNCRTFSLFPSCSFVFCFSFLPFFLLFQPFPALTQCYKFNQKACCTSGHDATIKDAYSNILSTTCLR